MTSNNGSGHGDDVSIRGRIFRGQSWRAGPDLLQARPCAKLLGDIKLESPLAGFRRGVMMAGQGHVTVYMTVRADLVNCRHTD